MQQTDHYSASPAPRRSRPAWLPTLVTVLMLPLLIGLGLWQLDRADQKRRLQADFAAGGASTPLRTAAELEGLDGLRRFQPISLVGRYLAGRQFLLDNMVHDGAAGYHVLTPFATDAGPVVIVNRGWVPKAYDGSLPDVTVAEMPTTIAGRVARLPRPAIAVGNVSADEGWPRRLHFPEAGDIAALLADALTDRPLPEALLLLDPGAEDGYVRAWQPTGTGPERHIAYALQWFAFAATLATIWVVMFFRRRRQNHD
jgi:surfeit locus 1 family protein